MKKVFILLFIILVSLGMRYAVSSSSETLVYSEEKPYSREAVVNLYLKPEGSFSYEFGFTSSGAIGDDVNPDAEFTLTPNISNDKKTVSFNETNNIYVYWNIFGNQSFTLYLSASDGLESTTEGGSATSIPWVITWTDDENTEHTLNGSDSSEKQQVMEYTVPSGWPIESDRVRLKVSPGQSVSMPAAEVYKGTLTLTVEVNG